METQLHISVAAVPDEMNWEIKNRDFVKPKGGFWTSTYDETYGSHWVQWIICENGYYEEESNTFDTHCTLVVPNKDAKIYTVDSLDDLSNLMELYSVETIASKLGLFSLAKRSLDFEKIANDYDAIHLTYNGQEATRFSMPYDLYGWDVESTLWLKPAFERVNLGNRAFKEDIEGELRRKLTNRERF